MLLEHVALKLVHPHRMEAALGACEGLLASVDSYVDVHVALLGEPGGAIGTRKRLLFGVHQHMRSKMYSSPCGVRAVHALEDLRAASFSSHDLREQKVSNVRNQSIKSSRLKVLPTRQLFLRNLISATILCSRR